MIAEFITPSDPRWDQTLARGQHDFYHLPGYVELEARREDAIPAAFYVEHRQSIFFIPVIIRRIPAQFAAPSDWKDICSPYGYPTPLLVGPESPGLLNDFLEAFHSLCRENNIVTGFLRLHPLLPLDLEVLARHGDVVEHGETVYIDLSDSADDMWRQTCRNHRQDIRKLIRSGFQAEINQWSYFREFMSLYWSTMKRCCADDFYFFSEDYFWGLHTALETCMNLCTICSSESKLAAAGLFTVVNGIMQAHLVGTADSFFEHAPSKLMFHHMRCWGKDQGIQVLHLGGGASSAGGSLLKFKTGFSNRSANYHTCRMVFDEEKYHSLNRMWVQNTGQSDCVKNSHFPLYRQRVLSHELEPRKEPA